MIEIRLKGCKVWIWPDDRYLETIFPDGCKVPAAPNFDPASRALALELGYGDALDATWRLSLWHEVCHSLLAEHLGQPFSFTLWAVAHHVRAERGLMHDEEQRVLALQRLIMTGDAGERAAWLEGVANLDALVQRARATIEPLEQVKGETA